MKPERLWDCWLYEEEALAAPSLAPPDEAQAAEEPQPGASPAEVAARVLEEELAGAVLVEAGALQLALAVREHGTGGPWVLYRAQVLALATSEVGWL